MINNKKLKEYWEFYSYVLENPDCSKEEITDHLERSTHVSISDQMFDRLKRELRTLGLKLKHDKNTGYSINESGSLLFKRMASFIQSINVIGIEAKDSSDLKEMLEYVYITESAFKGNENIDFLIQCCVEAKEIQFIHFHFQNDAKREKVVHPYQVRENQGRWYLIGIEPRDKKNGLKAFGIDRISQLKATGKNFERSSKHNPDSHYKDLIGLWSGKDEETVEVHLRTDTTTWKYIEALKWHHSQENLGEQNGYVEFTLRVKPTTDLITLLLQWTPHVKVIAPITLRKKLNSMLRDGLALNS